MKAIHNGDWRNVIRHLLLFLKSLNAFFQMKKFISEKWLKIILIPENNHSSLWTFKIHCMMKSNAVIRQHGLHLIQRTFISPNSIKIVLFLKKDWPNVLAAFCCRSLEFNYNKSLISLSAVLATNISSGPISREKAQRSQGLFLYRQTAQITAISTGHKSSFYTVFLWRSRAKMC